MSTYYYLLCNDCKEKSCAASRSAGGPCHLADSDYILPSFIIKHYNHKMKIVSEHDYELYDVNYEYKQWTKENMKELYYA